MTSEQDPDGMGIHEAGAKVDMGKDTFALSMGYFPNALAAINKESEFGAEKYSPFGWMKVKDGRQRYTEAMMRHLLKEFSGELTDDDSGMQHDVQSAWNALARLELRLKEETC